jgi:hypothetical protein
MVCQLLEDTKNFNGIAIDVPDCFNPPPTGLGLYLPAGSQTPTPPSLSASLPNTPGSWTSQVAISVEAPHLGEPKPDTWNSIFQDFTSLPDTTMIWNEANPFAPQEASEDHYYGSRFQESTGHASTLLPCQRTSIPTSYPNTSECYRPDGLYPATKIEQHDDWFEKLHKFDISPSVGTTQEGVISVPPTDPSPVDSYQLESNPFCPFTSTLASPNIRHSSDLPSSGKALRMNSLPGRPQEDLYEQAKKSVARTRKRRRMSTPTKANYVCHICGRPFSRNYNLRIHLPTHAPDRPKQWPCTWTGCDKVFTRRTDLVRHEKCVSASEFRQIFDC